MEYVSEVLEVHSGDDMILMVDLGHDGLYKKVRARLHGVDTPDAYKAKSATEAGQVRDKVKALTRDRSCRIQLHSQGKGGWVVSMYLGVAEDAVCINKALIAEGYILEQRHG